MIAKCLDPGIWALISFLDAKLLSKVASTIRNDLNNMFHRRQTQIVRARFHENKMGGLKCG